MVFPDEDVDFRANAKFRQVDAGLDGEAGPGNHAPFVVCFVVVHVGTGAMNFSTDGVACAMEEVVRVSFGITYCPLGRSWLVMVP